MPQKTTKQTTTAKKNSKEAGTKKNSTTKKTKQTTESKEVEKKVVIKRRKKDLTPTKASATAIISQANRAKKQALIEKLSEERMPQMREVEKKPSSSKVPLWVWIFFWCALLLFCVSFYLAILRPQIERRSVDIQVSDDFYWSSDKEENSIWEVDLSNISNEKNNKEEDKQEKNSEIISDPQNAEELIQSYFAYMSDWDFDNSFALFDQKAQNDKNIRDHFTAFRMAPFFGWIDWNSIIPQNIQKTTETYKWKEVYTFDISYILSSTQEQYDETRKFATSENNWNPRILMIYCVSNGCWRHPIFWPEDFGLMR